MESARCPVEIARATPPPEEDEGKEAAELHQSQRWLGNCPDLEDVGALSARDVDVVLGVHRNVIGIVQRVAASVAGAVEDISRAESGSQPPESQRRAPVGKRRPSSVRTKRSRY